MPIPKSALGLPATTAALAGAAITGGASGDDRLMPVASAVGTTSAVEGAWLASRIVVPLTELPAVLPSIVMEIVLVSTPLWAIVTGWPVVWFNTSTVGSRWLQN